MISQLLSLLKNHWTVQLTLGEIWWYANDTLIKLLKYISLKKMSILLDLWFSDEDGWWGRGARQEAAFYHLGRFFLNTHICSPVRCNTRHQRLSSSIMRRLTQFADDWWFQVILICVTPHTYTPETLLLIRLGSSSPCFQQAKQLILVIRQG